MSGIGGYVRRKDRRYVAPEPPDPRPRCGFCRALLWRLPHVCKEVIFGTAFPDAAGAFLHNMLGGSVPEPGPPYTHTLEGPFPPLPDYRPYRIEDAASSPLPDGPVLERDEP